MQLPYSDELEVQYLSRLFDNTSECCKFFWFQAIVSKVSEGREHIAYEEFRESGLQREDVRADREGERWINVLARKSMEGYCL